MRSIFPDQDKQRAFMERGYIRQPMLAGEEVAYILRELGSLRPNDGFAPDGFEQYNFTYHCSFLDTNIEYKQAAFELMCEVFAPRIAEALVGYEIFNCNFYVKPPGTGEFQIHQNWPALPDINDTTVTVWCPLTDTNPVNGTIHVVEGSHKIVPDIAALNCLPYFNDFQSALIEKHLEPISIRAGECLIFDDSLIHWSSRNTSDLPRYAIQILCAPVDETPVYYHIDRDGPQTHFELFEIDKSFFIHHHISDLNQRPEGLRTYGFVENRNKLLTEQDFAELLERGDDIRRRIYSKNKP